MLALLFQETVILKPQYPNVTVNPQPSTLSTPFPPRFSCFSRFVPGYFWAWPTYRQDRGFDVLLTSEWGEGFDNLMNVDDQFTLSAKDPSKQLRRPPSPAVGRLGRELSPRYHFGECEGARM